MIARDLISSDIFALRPTDTVGDALDCMQDLHLMHLPIAEKGEYYGVVSEIDLLDELPETLLSATHPEQHRSLYIAESSHFYDVLKAFSDYSIDIMPVVDTDQQLVGSIGIRNIMANLGHLFAVREAGDVLVVDIPPRSYSPAELGRIVESAGATLLSLYLNRNVEIERTQATLRVHAPQMETLIAALTRFGYSISESYVHQQANDISRRNFDGLMKFLNV